MPIIPIPSKARDGQWFWGVVAVRSYKYAPDANESANRETMDWDNIRALDQAYQECFPNTANAFRQEINESLAIDGIDPAFDTPQRLPDFAIRNAAGQTAALILDWLVRAKVSHPHLANVKAICHAIQQYQHEELGRVKRATDEVFEDWRRFKSVSHFWLAGAVWGVHFRNRPRSGHVNMHEQAHKLLSLAELLRLRAEEAGIFCKDEAWYVQDISPEHAADIRLPYDDGLSLEQLYYFEHSDNGKQSECAGGAPPAEVDAGGERKKRGRKPLSEQEQALGRRILKAREQETPFPNIAQELRGDLEADMQRRWNRGPNATFETVQVIAEVKRLHDWARKKSNR